MNAMQRSRARRFAKAFGEIKWLDKEDAFWEGFFMNMERC